MSDLDPIPRIKALISSVNHKKQELEALTTELYKMSLQDLSQFKGKKVTVCYLVGMKVCDTEVTQTIHGVLTAISASGQTITVKAELPGGPTSVYIKILSIVDMTVDE